MAVVADHSTDELVTSSGRWGTETQGTHFREGEAGHNVLLCGTTRGTLRPQLVSTQVQQSAGCSIVMRPRRKAQPWVSHWRAIGLVHASLWLLTNRMSELLTSGSVGGAVGNHCFYPAADSAFGARWIAAFWILWYTCPVRQPRPPGAAAQLMPTVICNLPEIFCK